MFRSRVTHFISGLLLFTLAACAPAQAANPAVDQPPAPVVAAPTSVPQPRDLPLLHVASVEVQIGVGSPIPVDTFISAELPDSCAQLAEVKQQVQDFKFEITLSVTPGTRAECFHDTLPFRMYVPLNMVYLPDGIYTVVVNGVSTTFQWPSAPTITPEPSTTAPSNLQTYRNDTIGFEVDYPRGWIVDEAGDTDIMWSERLTGPGHDGVPDNVVKIDITTEPNTTMTLEELVARQKQIIADNNGQTLLEEATTLPSSLKAVRLGVAGFGDSVTLWTVINGHPVMLTGYGDLTRFDEVANTLRPIQP
jgi:hypothetical protein